MKRFKLIPCLLMVVMMVVSITAASAGDTTYIYWPGDDVPEGIVEGSVLNASYIGQDFPTHLPWTRGSCRMLWAQIYDCLFYAHQGDPEDIRGAIAESWEFSEDMLSVVIQIRQGVTFTSGNVVNAQAIVDSYTVNAQMQATKFDNIASMEATGEYELTFTFKDLYPAFLLEFTDAVYGIVDPAALEEYGYESNDAAIGTGPYYVDSYSSGEVVVLKANPNYALPEKTPHIETINLYVIPNEETAVAALISGELDWMKSQSIESAYAVEDSGLFSDVIYYPSPVQAFYFNMAQNELFQNPAIREALVKMTDWESVCALVFDSINTPATSMWAADTPLYVDYTDYYYYAPEEGLEILAEAGIDPEDITFSILCNPNTVDIVIAIQGQLAQYGITVEADQVAVSAVRAVMSEGSYQVAGTPTGYGSLSPFSPFRDSLSPDATSILYDFSTYDQEFYDYLVGLYQEATTAESYEACIEQFRELTGILQENYIILGGYQSYEFFFHTDNLVNIALEDIGGDPKFCYFYFED